MTRTIALDIEHYSTEPEDLLAYGFDASRLTGEPAAVAWPANAGEVASVLGYAQQNTVAVIPRGAGTGTTGGAVPSKGAIVLSLERMNKILDIDDADLIAVVEPGVINGRLQRELASYGLFYPPDPASMEFCTIGGNVAENSGGPRAVKYGVTRDYVLALEAVLPTGGLIRTGKKTRKGVVGYDLTSLLVGSEGTLAVVTEITLKVIPLPEDVLTLLAVFGDAQKAGEAASGIMAARLIPRTLEIMDRESIKAVEGFSPVGLPPGAGALLLIELDGHPASIRAEAETVVGICESLNADVSMAEDEDAREALWKARRGVSPALYHACKGKIAEDIAVPLGKIPQMLASLQGLAEKVKIPIAAFGHAGDGNLHVNLLPAPGQDTAPAIRELFSMALELGGTISGEHGVGLTKKPFIGMEIKPPELELMRKIKRVFDPKGILNPGKIFP